MVLTSTLYVDFGDLFGSGLTGTIGTLRTATSGDPGALPVRGPNMNSSQNSDWASANMEDGDGFTLTSFAASYVASGLTYTGGITQLRADIMGLVERFYAPFDIDVVELTASSINVSGNSVQAASSLADVSSTLTANEAEAKNNDAYVLLGTMTVARDVARGGNFDPSTLFGGYANGIDTPSTNDYDNTAIGFVNGGYFGVNNVAAAIANLVAHEAGHLFGLQHSLTKAPTDPSVSKSLANSEIMAYNVGNDFNFFSRFPMVRGNDNTSDNDDLMSTPTPYDQLANTPSIGVNTDFHYVTGTGANDIITLTKTAADTIHVKVEAFDTFMDDAYSDPLSVPGTNPDEFSYEYDLVGLTGRYILVDAGGEDDRIVIDGDLGVVVTARGMDGSDSIVINGKGAASATYVPGDNSNDGLDGESDLQGKITFANTTINFSEFETDGKISINDVGTVTLRTEGGIDKIDVVQNFDNTRNQLSGSSGGVDFTPLEIVNVPDLIIDTSPNDAKSSPSDDVYFSDPFVSSGLKNVTVDFGNGDDELVSFIDDLSLPVAGGGISVKGGEGDDTLTDATASKNSFSVTGANTGKYETILTFSDTENLVGGFSDDTFTFAAAGSLAGTVNGNAGGDLLDLSALGAQDVRLTGQGSSDGFDGKTVGGPIANGFLSINSITGSQSATSDTLTGTDLFAGWKIDSVTPDFQYLTFSRTLQFLNFENLNGGSNVDFFSFAAGSSLPGKIDGKGGLDFLDFSALTAQDVRLSDIGSIDGFDGTTVGGTIGNGFANIDGIAGSTSATTDKLTGIDATALWTIDSETSNFTYESKGRTLAFSNFEELTGGSKVDQFDMKATSFAMILNGEGDDDFFNFDSGDLDNYQGKVTIHGGADNSFPAEQRDRIYLDDQGGDNGEERFDYRLEPHSVTWLQTNFAPDRMFAGVFFDETMEFVRLDGNDGVNRFSVRPSEFTVFYVDGNEPGVEDCPPGGGDYLQLDLAPLPPVDPNPVTGPKITFTEVVNGRQTKGVWTFDPPHQEVRFESIERFNLLDKLTVSDDAGFNSLPLIDVISATTLTKYSDVVTNFSPDALEAFSVFDYPVFQPGAMPASLAGLDVNNDGMISPKDLQLLIDHLDEQPGQYDPRLDANRDGSINPLDLVSFLSAIVVQGSQNHVVGGVRTTTADLNCDGIDEIIAVSGANLAPRIQVFNGVTGEAMSISQTIGDPSNTYGVYVSAGDFDGDGMVEIATSMERGSQAVTIWKWADDHFEKVREFDSGFDPNANGGVRVSTGDLNGDLTDEIIVSPGTGHNPSVSIFTGTGTLLGVVQVDSAYGRGGLTTTTGDLDGDGYDEILILAGRRGGSLLSYVPGSANISANTTAVLLGALYTGDDALSPLSGTTKDADGDGDDELFIGQLSDGRSSIVRKLDWNDAIDQFFDDGFFATDDDWTGDFLG